MSKDDIQITVLMPAFNAAKYIAEAIESVLSQSFSAFELLVIDDGSTDDTARIVSQFDDPRVVYIRQPNGGIALALNSGLKLARADYIARFDADDICYPRRLEMQYEYMMKHPDCIVVGSGAEYVDTAGNFIFYSRPAACTDREIRQLPYSICPFIHSSVLYKKETVLAAGGYNIHALSYEDHFLWLRISQQGEFINLEAPLIKVRLSPESLTIDERWRTRDFISVKYRSLRTGIIQERDGVLLREILKDQDNKKIKTGSYHALLAKKLLWNNYQPSIARKNIIRAIASNWTDWRNYSILVLTYLPRGIILRMYSISKRKNDNSNKKQRLAAKQPVHFDLQEY
jgi:glycosyltransferase involved in cell wall biosynthesis